MEPILSLKNVCSYYDKVQVLYDINVDVYPARSVSVIGANGAGKSTMMKTIMGLVHMGRGEVTFDGKKLNRMHAHKICKAGIAYVPEGREVLPEHDRSGKSGDGRILPLLHGCADEREARGDVHHVPATEGAPKAEGRFHVRRQSSRCWPLRAA